MRNPENVLISVREIEEALNKMKNAKAAGEDEITVDMINAVGDTEVKWFHRLLCVCGIKQE